MEAGLRAGAVDGKYMHLRPDTEVSAMNAGGNRLVHENRATLNPLDGYPSVEHPAQIVPASTA